MRSFSFQAGRLAEAGLVFIGDGLGIVLEATGFIARGRLRIRQLVQQMAIIGADSLSLCVLILFSGGMVFGLNIAKSALRYGAQDYVGGPFAVMIAREVGPILVGILVAARAGAAMAAEIGSMAVTEQIDALRALAVSPVRYLVVPRLLAAMIMLPVLTVLADLSGGIGGYVVSLRAGISSNQFIHSASVFLSQWDILGGLVKTVVFGIIIVITCCRQGLRTEGGAVGVGRATTSAVVISIVLILVSDYFLTALIVLPLVQR